MFEFKPDYEECKKRIEAWWECQVLDRPPVHITLPREKPVMQVPSHTGSVRERWLDADYQSDLKLANCANTLYLGDAMPVAHPNLGPEAFTSWFGAELEFTDRTSWSAPILHSWDDFDKLHLDMDNFYFRKMVELTDALLEKGRGKFITGLMDFHVGGDHLAALRDPQTLAMDVIEHPQEIKRALEATNRDFFRAYDFFYEKLRDEGLPTSTWTPLVADGRYYVPSNDFSCMVSKKQFDDIFLPGIVEECRFLDYSIYHLDGPGALHHLDALLGIEELNALQWVPGAGNEGFDRWRWVYKRAQEAGKGIQLRVRREELDSAFQTLRPEGCWVCAGGITSPQQAEDFIQRVAKWK